MSKIFLIFVALGFLLFVGCSEDDTGTNGYIPDESGPIMPLAVGNVWSGTQITYYTNGSMTDTLMYYITDSTIVNDDVWYEMYIKRSGTHVPYAWLTYREDEGLFMAGCDSALDAGECEIFLKDPAMPGDVYETDLGGDDKIDTMYVVSTDEKVTVLDESRDCNHYFHWCADDSASYNYFMVPNIGFAQTTYYTGFIYTIWTLDTAIILGN